MRHHVIPALLLAAGCFTSTGCALLFPDLGPARDVGLASVAGLEGCWVGSLRGETVEECWGRPSGGSMLGTSRTVANGSTSAFEYLRIELRGDRPVYVAAPMGGAPTEFPLTAKDGTTLAFENPAHDFPRRIVYFVASRHLGVRLEGVEDGEARLVEYTLHRR